MFFGKIKSKILEIEIDIKTIFELMRVISFYITGNEGYFEWELNTSDRGHRNHRDYVRLKGSENDNLREKIHRLEIQNKNLQDIIISLSEELGYDIIRGDNKMKRDEVKINYWHVKKREVNEDA